MKLKKVLTISVLFLMSAAIVIAAGVKLDDWYEVEDWELEVCSKWGGTEEAQSGASSSSPIYLSQITLTLQGKKEAYSVPNATTLYKASWYLEPTAKVSYKVELIGNDMSEKIGEGEASYDAPAQGYYADYLDAGFSYVKMTYGGKWIQVPLVG
ncbi:MAG: hypothetical protein KJ561_05025 [Nanoarchaeota archaeon]|nr:hypothetical protein [Nanoarchaeota archaeon]